MHAHKPYGLHGQVPADVAHHLPVVRRPRSSRQLQQLCLPLACQHEQQASAPVNLQGQRPKDGNDCLGLTCSGHHQLFNRRALMLALTTCSMWAHPHAAQASKLPAIADKMWESMGGGPSDLTFPEAFLGIWDVTSVLKQVELPLGEQAVADMAVVRRAQTEIDKPITYQVAFTRNARSEVVFDRAFNTAALLSFYYSKPTSEFLSRIDWNMDDPNVLELNMPGGLEIRTRVTRRMEELPGPDRIETSEYIEQVFDTSGMNESSSPAPRLKVSQCFTKYKWRAEVQVPPGQPGIVATQVVSDFVAPVSGKELLAVQAGNRPVTTYTYRMAFVRANPQGDSS